MIREQGSRAAEGEAKAVHEVGLDRGDNYQRATKRRIASLPALDELFTRKKAVLVPIELGEALLRLFAVGLPGEILVERELGFAGVEAVVTNIARLVGGGGGGLGG